MSKYHICKLDNGAGWEIIKLDKIGGCDSTIIDIKNEERARDLLADLRLKESTYNERLLS
jgi:hypothetical protein